MGKRSILIAIIVILCILITGAFFGFNHKKNYLKPVNNQTYKDECGACHFAYQPELLPSASWLKILSNLDDHFGEVVETDDDLKKIIAAYLVSNGAENSTAKRAVKIMKSLNGKTPMRITDIPYIKEKHYDEFSPEILKRKSIGSLSNCEACHTTAIKGIYEDNYVEIPD
ncbi:MAG: cytochrome C [Desulfobacterales bacterium]|nr:cytochrome C [Desulfobacterales bacterium]